MEISKIKIFIPVPKNHTTTSMYLPLFIAKEKGIITDIVKNVKGVDKNVAVIIETPNEQGDSQAINAMTNCHEEGTLVLAIADPNGLQENHGKAIVIGALVSKLSFWAIAGKKKDSLIRYDRIVYYDEHFKTGCMIGRKMVKKLGIDSKNEKMVKNIGDEFNYLSSQEHPLIITPDLLRVAENCTVIQSITPKAFRIISFAEENNESSIDDEYVTTAIFARESDIKDFKELISAIIGAIQKAKFVLYSSKQIATETLKNMDCIQELKKAKKYTDDQMNLIVDYVIERMQEERFYPFDTNISKRQWKKTIEKKSLKYYTFVDNDIVIKAENSLAKEIGITIMNFLPKPIVGVIKYIRRYWWAIFFVLLCVFFVYLSFEVEDSIITRLGAVFSILVPICVPLWQWIKRKYYDRA